MIQLTYARETRVQRAVIVIDIILVNYVLFLMLRWFAKTLEILFSVLHFH